MLRCGCVAYATEQGLGHLMRDMYRAGLVTDPLIMVHGRRESHFEWYPSHTPQIRVRNIAGPDIEDWINRIDVFLALETPFDWELCERVRAAGKRTALMPMYEWMLRQPPHRFDVMVCPSLLDLDYFKAPGNPWCKRAEYIPVPVPQDIWRPRERARHWLHNAGNVGYRFHKGTVELLKAVKHVRNPDWRMTVRAQDADALQQAIDAADYRPDPRVQIVTGYLPYANLWAGYDVLIAPEKLNGLSLPLQEGRAAGMVVMTTDRHPTNKWLPNRVESEECHCGLGREDHKYPGAAEHSFVPHWSVNTLFDVDHYQRACISPNYLEFDEAIVRPEEIARRIDDMFDADISEYSQSAVSWVRDWSWDALLPRYRQVLAG